MPRPADLAAPQYDTTQVVGEPTQYEEPALPYDEAVPSGATGVTRTRRAVPEGLTIGLLSEPVKAEPTDVTPATKTTNQQTLQVITHLEQNPGEWFHVGNFSSQTMPRGIWVERGIKFAHRKHPEFEGYYMRYAMKPLQAEQ